ncbi:DUF3987 domain-containing protein [Pectobacterium brasiliense]|uniref:YfjI family protein n=1 Tax=Pectobacterium brasiliense TaxID=180957 RepID=UPI001968E931|nr:YfjI family protein [Pectobacterium brasiliense]MBN3102252.1 DUF3987 domain-containing protein [Pectobacterium brasiliense]
MPRINKNKKIKELCLQFQTLPTFAQRLTTYTHVKTGAAAELIFTVLLGVMAYACQDKFDVHIKNGKTFTSLYILFLARSGSRKSTVFKLFMEKIFLLEKELKNDFLLKEKIYELKLTSWETELKEFKKQYSKAIRQKTDVTEALNALEECQRRKPAVQARKYLTKNDTTSEGLRKVLAQGSPSLLLGSDEAGGLFESNLFRNTPVLNSLWGEGKIADSRASRDSYDVDDVRLSMLLMAQPDLFDDFLDKQGKKVKSSGWLARLLLIDMEQPPELCKIPDACLWSGESGLEEFFSILTKHLQDGIKRREKNEERICVSFSSEAQILWDSQSEFIHKEIKKGGELQQYDDFGSRFMEQASRIAAVMQMFITPDSPIITKETLISSIKITECFINHLIIKIDSTREPTRAEKLTWYLEDNLVRNGSYDFKKNEIIKKGPYSVRNSENLTPTLEQLESEGVVQLFERGGINYVKFIGSKMEPKDLAEKTNTPILGSGSIAMSKLPIP